VKFAEKPSVSKEGLRSIISGEKLLPTAGSYFPPWNLSVHHQSIHTYLLTYLLTPWSRVLLEKLTGLQLVKKFPAFYGTRRFITAHTSARHLSQSWASSIQSTYPHPTSRRSILILSSHLSLGLPSGLLPSGFPTKTLYTPPLPHTRYVTRPSHYSWFYHPHNIGCGVQIIQLLIM
jgi:hypothetical protein